jgi:adenosylhomocysteine nucleosidase
MNDLADVVVIISANAEWQVARQRLEHQPGNSTPFGEMVTTQMLVHDVKKTVVYFHGGWGKIAAAASTQFAIDRWQPQLLINLGTCGGLAGDIAIGTIILVDFTIVYDIIEQMGDPDIALAHYATELDLSWLRNPYPIPVRRDMLLSADRDIVAGEISTLRTKYGAVAADWESGAIAYVATKNGTRCLILRGVSDLVSPDGGEAYGRLDLFAGRTSELMNRLLDSMPGWLAVAL